MGYCDDYLFLVQLINRDTVRDLVEADFWRFGFVLGWNKCNRNGSYVFISLGITVDLTAFRFKVPMQEQDIVIAAIVHIIMAYWEGTMMQVCEFAAVVS